MAKPLHRSLATTMSVTAAAMILLLRLNAVEANPWSDTSSVLIYNLDPGVVVVDCVCRHCHHMSKTLTQQNLAYKVGYYFEFKMGLLGNSYVWCKMVHGQQWNAFKIWTPPGLWGQKRMPCQQCVLEIRPEGFYRGQSGDPQYKFDFLQPWLSPLPPPALP